MLELCLRRKEIHATQHFLLFFPSTYQKRSGETVGTVYLICTSFSKMTISIGNDVRSQPFYFFIHPSSDISVSQIQFLLFPPTTKKNLSGFINRRIYWANPLHLKDLPEIEWMTVYIHSFMMSGRTRLGPSHMCWGGYPTLVE